MPLFAALPAEEIHHIVKRLKQSDHPAGSILYLEGELGDRFSIIVDGIIEVVKSLGAREERVLTTMGPGEVMGEMSLFDPSGLRSASLRAKNPVTLLEMTHQDFSDLLDRHPRLAVRLMSEMVVRFRAGEEATNQNLREKNLQLAEAYLQLQMAQTQIVEKEKMDHEVRLARRIQESQLPKEAPSYPGWYFNAHWKPARTVSGDFYDFIPLPDGTLAIIIGDVAGKGIPAAMVMSNIRNILRYITLYAGDKEACLSPGKVLSEVNNLMVEEPPSPYHVTCLVGILNPADGDFRLSNAGHSLPILRSEADLHTLYARGMPLGWLPDQFYEEISIKLKKDDSLILFSDGCIEAHNPKGEMFGLPRFEQIIRSCPTGPDLAAYILDSLAEFTGNGVEQEDDITLVVFGHY
jgi:serine phosphatase RsbU (regulator of sigma subunit)